MAEDISTLVLQVKSDGIKEGTSQLNDLTKAALAAETATSKLGTEVTSTSASSSKASATAKAFAEATDSTTKATSRLTLEQRKQVYEFNESAKAYKAAASEAYKINAAIDANTVSSVTALKATDNYQKQLDAATRSMGLLQMQALKMNSAVDAAEPAQKKLALAVASGTAEVKKNTSGHGSNAASMRESMVLIHELSQGSYKRFGGSIMVLTNQLGLIPSAMEAIGAASRATQFAVLGLIGVVGLLTFAFIAGQVELTNFNNHLALTGNQMGVTIDTIEKGAHTIADSTKLSVDSARDVLKEMAVSGTVSSENMILAGTVMTEYKKMSGDTSAEAVKHFAGMKDGVEKFALESGKTGIAVGAHAIEMIHNFELVGDTVNASRVYFEAYGAKLGEVVVNADAKLNALGKTLKFLGEAGSEFGHWLINIGNTATASEQIADLDHHIASLQKRIKNGSPLAALWKSQILDDEKEKEGVIADMAVKEGIARVEHSENMEKRVSEAAQARWEAETKRVRDGEEKFAAMEKALRNDGMLAHHTQDEIEKAVELARDKWIKDHRERGMDDAATLRDTEIVGIKSSHKQQTEAYETFLNESKTLAASGESEMWTELVARNSARDEELRNISANYKEQLAVLNKFHGDTRQAIAENEKKKAELTSQYVQSATVVLKSGKSDSDGVAAKEAKDQAKLLQAINATGAAEDKRLDTEMEGYQKRLAKIDELKSVGIAEESRLKQKAIDEAEADVARYNGIIATQAAADALGTQNMVFDAAEVAAAQRSLDFSKMKLDRLHDHAKALDDIYAKQVKMEAHERDTKNIDAQLAAVKRWDKAMTDAFGNVGHAIGGVATAIIQYSKENDIAAAKMRDASDADKESGKAKADFDKETENNRINGYANMASSAAGFFDKQSKGYKIMEGVSQAFHIAQLARNVAQTISGLAAGAAQMFASMGPGGFAGVAAMVAVVAALGFSAASASNKGGQSAADVQKSQGTGSVFGDASAKSESVSKSIETLQANSSVMLPLTSAMLKSLQAIQASMVGLTNLIIRTDGVTSGGNMGIQTGMLSGGTAVTNMVATIGEKVFGTNNILGTLSRSLANLYSNTKQTIVDAGLQFGGKVSDLQSGKGFNQYASVDTTKSSFFGVVKNTTNAVATTGLNDELSKQFALVFTNLESTLKLAATSLGKSSTDVGNTINNLVLETTKVSLKDLKGEDLTKAINGVISKAMDQVAEAAFPAMGDFRQVGEGYAQTVIRVASGIEQAQVALQQLGVTAIDYTAITNKQGDVAAEMVRQSVVLKEGTSGVGTIINGLSSTVTDLVATYKNLVDVRQKMQGTGLGSNLNSNQITGAGGLDALSKSLDNYSSKYFTATERVKASTDKLGESFAAIGEPLPKTTADLRAMIEAASKLGTVAGDTLVGQLLALAGGFSDLTDSMAALDTQRTDMVTTIATYENNAAVLRNLTLAQRDKELKAMDASLRPMQERVYAIEDEAAALTKLAGIASSAFSALSAAVTAQKDALTATYDAQVKAINDKATVDKEAAKVASDAAKVQLNSVKKVFDAITSALSSTAVTSAAINSAIRKEAQATLQAASDYADGGGSLDKFAGLDDALKAIVKPSETMFSTFVDYARDQAKTASVLTNLQSKAGGQVDYAQLTVDRLDGTITAIDQASKAQLAALETAHNSDLKALDAQLAAAQSQLDAVNGVNTSILSLTDAIKGFAAAVTAAQALKNASAPTAVDNATKAAQSAGTGGGTLAALTSLYKDMLGRTPDASGLKFWTDAMNSGQTVQQIAGGFANSDEYKSLHKFDVGTNYVPEDMPAMVHKGERIIPVADNAALMNKLNANDKSQTSSDINELKASIDGLKAAVQTGDIANVQMNKEVFKILRKWDNEGQPETRTV